jgi:myo-inositol-1-phosphate synthase
MKKIKIAIAGVGNCSSSLVQGINYYKNKDSQKAIGLMHWDIGGYEPSDIEVVAAFDIDRRKVGKDVSEAIFALPNCTTVFLIYNPETGVKVQMGRILDGLADHMKDYPDRCTFVLAKEEATGEDIVEILKRSGAEILLNYMPVGSEKATKFYAQCALEAGVAFINNMPVFIASGPEWAEKFKERNIPIIGDDIKSQLGATIVHRVLTTLFKDRG